jgi:hypothetical protein
MARPNRVGVSAQCGREATSNGKLKRTHDNRYEQRSILYARSLYARSWLERAESRLAGSQDTFFGTSVWICPVISTVPRCAQVARW